MEAFFMGLNPGEHLKAQPDIESGRITITRKDGSSITKPLGIPTGKLKIIVPLIVQGLVESNSRGSLSAQLVVGELNEPANPRVPLPVGIRGMADRVWQASHGPFTSLADILGVNALVTTYVFEIVPHADYIEPSAHTN